VSTFAVYALREYVFVLSRSYLSRFTAKIRSAYGFPKRATPYALYLTSAFRRWAFIGPVGYCVRIATERETVRRKNDFRQNSIRVRPSEKRKRFASLYYIRDYVPRDLFAVYYYNRIDKITFSNHRVGPIFNQTRIGFYL